MAQMEKKSCLHRSPKAWSTTAALTEQQQVGTFTLSAVSILWLYLKAGYLPSAHLSNCQI